MNKETLNNIVLRVEHWVIGIMEWNGGYEEKDHEQIMKVINKLLQEEQKDNGAECTKYKGSLEDEKI